MRCYDFDKTIYRKDSSLSFFLFCVRKKPILIFHFVKCLFLLVFNKIGFIKTEKFKQSFFSFVKKFKNINEIVEQFWKKEEKNINSWYLKQKEENDVICSASPEFLLKPIVKKINPNSHLVCTQIDIETGKINGRNIKGEEKVVALKKYFNNNDITFKEVYTDSMSDFPILDLTENKFIVGKKGLPYRFGEQKPSFAVKIKYIIKQLRVKHYVKNGLIFLPLFFSNQLLNVTSLLKVVIGFVSFCLMASTIYILNDLMDVKKDRKHKQKRKRPIACYMIKQYEAVVMAIILFTLSITLTILIFGLNYLLLAILVGYAILNLLYSTYLKNLPIVDVFVLALCYLVRIFFGGIIISTAISKWLYLTVLCGALFMGFGKRRNEVKQEKENTRKVNKFYNYSFLDKNLYISLAMCLVFYSLWAIDFNNLGFYQLNRILLYSTIPLVMFIMMKYSLNIENENNNGDPIDVFLKDKILIFSVFIFLVLIIVSIYVPIKFNWFY